MLQIRRQSAGDAAQPARASGAGGVETPGEGSTACGASKTGRGKRNPRASCSRHSGRSGAKSRNPAARPRRRSPARVRTDRQPSHRLGRGGGRKVGAAGSRIGSAVRDDGRWAGRPSILHQPRGDQPSAQRPSGQERVGVETGPFRFRDLPLTPPCSPYAACSARTANSV